MSCKCNGISMCEGRRNFAMMPAVVQCDNRHPVDPRPLTRAQIAAIPGVRFQAFKPRQQSAPKIAKQAATINRKTYGKINDQDLAGMVKQYKASVPIQAIAEMFGRDRSTVREALKRIGVYVAVYQSRINPKKKEAA